MFKSVFLHVACRRCSKSEAAHAFTSAFSQIRSETVEGFFIINLFFLLFRCGRQARWSPENCDKINVITNAL